MVDVTNGSDVQVRLSPRKRFLRHSPDLLADRLFDVPALPK
jgi:hypothetical protein